MRADRGIKQRDWRCCDDFGSPTVRRRELGAGLHKLRTELGLTQEEVADELVWSASKVRRVETVMGQRSLHASRDVRVQSVGRKPTKVR